MKNWFFHQERGQTLGPITLEVMKERIREGRIRLFDLIYREGEPGWRMALEHPDLRGEFKNTTVQTMTNRPWVCLQRKSENGFDFGTAGPFTTEDIRLALQEGRIAYSDYVWKDGFSEWKRIGTIADFNRRLGERKDKPKPEIMPPLPDVPAGELLKSVVEVKRPKVKAPLPPPPEAAGEDLTLKSPPAEKPPAAAPKRPPPGAPMDTPPSYSRASRRRRTSAWVDWGVVAVLAIVLCAVVMTLSRYMMRANEADTEPPIKEPPPLSAEHEAAPPAPEPPPEPVKPPPVEPVAAEKPLPVKPEVKNVAPSELYLAVQTVGGNQVKIDIRTDAGGPDYPVYVQIVGLPGQVAEGAAFYKYMKLTNKGNRREPLDLSGLKLPQGRFILRAETGKLRKEARMNVGVAETQYKQNVARLRKVYAYAIWKERLELFQLAGLLDKQLTQTLSGKKFSAKGLGALGAVNRNNGANYILFDNWYELKEILTAARSAPSMALLARLKQAREKLSTFSVWK